VKIAKLLVLASLIAISAPSAEAKQMYPQRYDAHYIMTTEHLPVEIRTSSDGKGRLRSEVSNSGLNRSITLTDYVGGVVYRISTAPRMVFKTPLKEPYEGDFDDAAAKKKNAISLGRKSIKGRMCLGWAFKQDGVACEVWVDEKARFLAHSETKDPRVISKMELVDANTDEQPESLFEIPSSR